jgi:hypothetical protein
MISNYISPEFNEGPFVLSHGDLHQPNLLVDENLHIVAVLDWEWSCILPIQVACLPPPCLSQRKLEDIALGEGRSEFLAAANIFLDCLGEKERSIQAENRLSETQKEMMSNGLYWFGIAMHEIYCFEYLFWDNLFPVSFTVSENEAIDSVCNGPERSLVEEIAKRKERENAKYLEELEALKVTNQLF